MRGWTVGRADGVTPVSDQRRLQSRPPAGVSGAQPISNDALTELARARANCRHPTVRPTPPATNNGNHWTRAEAWSFEWVPFDGGAAQAAPLDFDPARSVPARYQPDRARCE
jgi:hypothetical protein